MRHEKHTVFIQRKELVERNTAERVCFTLRSTGVPLISPETALGMDVQNKILESTFCFFNEILDHYLNCDDKLELQLNWVPDYEATGEPRNNVRDEASNWYIGVIHSVNTKMVRIISSREPQGYHKQTKWKDISQSGINPPTFCFEHPHHVYTANCCSLLRQIPAHEATSEIGSEAYYLEYSKAA